MFTPEIQGIYTIENMTTKIRKKTLTDFFQHPIIRSLLPIKQHCKLKRKVFEINNVMFDKLYSRWLCRPRYAEELSVPILCVLYFSGNGEGIITNKKFKSRLIDMRLAAPIS
jgi:hypothetical protein